MTKTTTNTQDKIVEWLNAKVDTDGQHNLLYSDGSFYTEYGNAPEQDIRFYYNIFVQHKDSLDYIIVSGYVTRRYSYSKIVELCEGLRNFDFSTEPALFPEPVKPYSTDMDAYYESEYVLRNVRARVHKVCIVPHVWLP